MTYREFNMMLRRNRWRDEWWLAVDGEVLNVKVSISSVLIKRKHYEGRRLQLLHIEDAAQERLEWYDFEYCQGIRLRPGAKFGQTLNVRRSVPKRSQSHATVPTNRSSQEPKHAERQSVRRRITIPLLRVEKRVVQNKGGKQIGLNRASSQTVAEELTADNVKLRLKEKEMELLELEKSLIAKQRELDLREKSIEENAVNSIYEHEERQVEFEQLAESFDKIISDQF